MSYVRNQLAEVTKVTPTGTLNNRKSWLPGTDSNRRPSDQQSLALPLSYRGKACAGLYITNPVMQYGFLIFWRLFRGCFPPHPMPDWETGSVYLAKFGREFVYRIFVKTV